MKSKLSHKLIIRRLCVNTSDITDEPLSVSLSIYPRPACCITRCHYARPIIRTRCTFTYVQQVWGLSRKVFRPCNFQNWISYTTQHSSVNAFLNWCRWPSSAIAPFLKTDKWFRVAYCQRDLKLRGVLWEEEFRFEEEHLTESWCVKQKTKEIWTY